LDNAKIREAKRDELAAIVTLYNLMWTDSDSPLDTKIGENIFDQMREHGQLMYVVEVEGRVVAAFMMLMTGDEEPVCDVDNVVVHPRYQRKGIGRMMMGFVTACCRKAGSRRIIVSNRQRRELPFAFLDAMGFERTSVGYVKTLD
jgi:N-acetylglutamate synthase-like GNAT family acetyltransferase